jgi:Rieske Fe-S protein
MPDDAVSRRTFLDRLLFTSLAAVGVTALAPIPFFLRPPPEPKPPRVRVDGAELKRAPVVSIQYGGGGAVVIQSSNGIRVLSKRCTHQGCDVKLNLEKSEFECPCHGAIFDFEGRPLRGPHNGPLASIPHRTVDGELEVGE